MLTNDDVQKVADEVLPNVLRGLRRELEEQGLRQAKEVAQAAIGKAVQEFVTTEILPAVHVALAESKDGLIAMAPQLATQITEQLSKALRDSLQKKLESGWERKKLFEAIIG